MEVEQAEDAVAGEVGLGGRDAVQVAVVVAARTWLDPLVDQAETDGVEAVALQEGGVVIPETLRRGRVRGHLGDHVDAMQDRHAALGVRDPATGVTERRCRSGLRGGREQDRSDGRQRGRRCASPHPAHAGSIAGRG
jgi:hypothetical protein